MTDAPTSGSPPEPKADDRLESWKEIASYLRRDVKTVQRWERREGLPVHRHRHDRQASVFALRSEINDWRMNRGRQALADELRSSNGAGAPEPLATEVIAAPEPDARPAAPPLASESVRGAPRSRTIGLVMTALALLACGGLAGWAVARSGPRAAGEPHALTRFHIQPPAGTAFAGNSESPEPVLSPDGGALIFRAAQVDTGRQALYLRRLDSPDALLLEGTDSAMQPFWSPDGRQLGFFADGWLRTLELATGRVRSLVRCSEPLGGAWVGAQIVYSPAAGSALMTIADHGGTPSAFTRLNTAAGELRHTHPTALPNGAMLFFVTHQDRERQGVAAVRKKLETPLWIIASSSMLSYSPAGYLLRFRSGSLIAHRFDLRNLAVSGEPVVLTDRIEPTADFGHSTQASAAGDVLAYWDPRGGSLARLTWFDRQGRELGAIGPAGYFAAIDLSPRGDALAVQRLERVGAAPDIWVFDLIGGGFTRLTSAPGNDEDPMWAPDSSRLVYARHRAVGQPSDLHVLAVARPLEDAPLWKGELSAHPTDWSIDGKWIVFQAVHRERGSDVWLLPVGGGEATAVVRSEFDEMHGRLSPGSRFLAYSSDRSGRREVYVRSVAGSPFERQISNAGGAHPRWRADGRELFYMSEQGHINGVTVAEDGEFRAGVPVPLFDARPVMPLVFSDVVYDVSEGGTRFIVAAGPRAGAKPITVVLNWPADLPR